MLTTACKSDVTDDLNVATNQSTITMIARLNETAGSSVENFDAASWFRNNFGVVVDATSLIYPELQIIPHFGPNGLTLEAKSRGAVQFNGTVNQTRVDKVYIGVNGAGVDHRVKYKYFFNEKKKRRGAIARIQELTAKYHQDVAEALASYELTIEEALEESPTLELKIPGKDSKGETRVFTFKPSKVEVSCTELNNYLSDYVSTEYGAWDRNVTLNLVDKTACTAILTFALGRK
jgi:hypothetical protein